MGLVAPRHVGSSRSRDRTRVPCIGRQILNHYATREARQLFSFSTLKCCSTSSWPSWFQLRNPLPFKFAFLSKWCVVSLWNSEVQFEDRVSVYVKISAGLCRYHPDKNGTLTCTASFSDEWSWSLVPPFPLLTPSHESGTPIGSVLLPPSRV